MWLPIANTLKELDLQNKLTVVFGIPLVVLKMVLSVKKFNASPNKPMSTGNKIVWVALAVYTVLIITGLSSARAFDGAEIALWLLGLQYEAIGAAVDSFFKRFDWRLKYGPQRNRQSYTGEKKRQLKLDTAYSICAVSAICVAAASGFITYNMDVSNQAAVTNVRVFTVAITLVFVAAGEYFAQALTVAIYIQHRGRQLTMQLDFLAKKAGLQLQRRSPVQG